MTETRTDSRYSVLIQWSTEDDIFIVTLPEWRDQLIGAAGHGRTYEEALAAGKITLDHLISIAIERGDPLPEPQLQAVAA